MFAIVLLIFTSRSKVRFYPKVLTLPTVCFKEKTFGLCEILNNLCEHGSVRVASVCRLSAYRKTILAFEASLDRSDLHCFHFFLGFLKIHHIGGRFLCHSNELFQRY